MQVAGRLAGDHAGRGGARRSVRARVAPLRLRVIITCVATCAARTSVSTLSRIDVRDLERAEPVPAGHGRRLARRARRGRRRRSRSRARRPRAPRAARSVSDGCPSSPGSRRQMRTCRSLVVDREVGVGLEDAELPLALERDAARRHVGDAAVREAEPRVGDVDRRREHRDADRLDRAQRRRHHAEDDVEVVDHQVEDDVDVGAALGERRQAVALDEARLRDRARRARGSPG